MGNKNKSWTHSTPLKTHLIIVIRMDSYHVVSGRKKITLLYKKGEHENLQNWRPLNLLDYDYKILPYVLASRLQKVIGNIVKNDQTGYIKGRFVGQNIRLIQDIIELASDADFLEQCIIFIDFHKAFDTLEFNFIHNCLKEFGFGETFIN